MSQAKAGSLGTACERRSATLDDIATRLGYPPATVMWIAGALFFVGKYERKGAGTGHVDAAELCRMLVADFDEREPAQVAARLGDMGLNSSRDIGRIVYALVDAELCQIGENDRELDFDAVFDRETADRYVADVLGKRPRDWPVIAKQTAIVALLVAGLAVVEIGGRNQAAWSSAFVASGLFGIAWLLWRLRWPWPMRFGLPWSRVRPRRAAGDA